MKETTEILLVLDPMCSWCWGFHPVVESLRTESASHGYTLSLVMGGLRTSGEMVWDADAKAYLRYNWRAIEQRTGQIFGDTLFEKEHFDYDTYPSCKAVLTVRELWGTAVAFSYLAEIQKAFYVRGEDITSLECLLGYIKEDQKVFLDYYHSEQAQTMLANDFSKARAMGANAFPSIVKIDNAGHMFCMKGYRTLDEIIS